MKKLNITIAPNYPKDEIYPEDETLIEKKLTEITKIFTLCNKAQMLIHTIDSGLDNAFYYDEDKMELLLNVLFLFFVGEDGYKWMPDWNEDKPEILISNESNKLFIKINCENTETSDLFMNTVRDIQNILDI